ncbi:hypothetical protein MTR67_031277 [Solanum verrucosum]|uniref:Uncharacterized protein n=1 Tax=Solanum verrucosum TaxID=315347 RepID=A0AAF0ZEQ5_SOLVR|nr:hypothetical protein MTR67_031277 [Solanum verrucosum]
MQHLFDIASTLLDEMTKIDPAWYTRVDQVSPLNFGLTKEEMEKNQERDKNMAKMMTQLTLLKKHVMGSGHEAMNLAEARFGNKEMSQLSSPLESQPQESYANDMMVNSKINHEKCLAMLTRSERVVGGDMKVDGKVNTGKEGNNAIDVEGSGQKMENDTPKEVDEVSQKLITGELKTSKEGDSSSSKPTKPLPNVNPPFPQRQKKMDENAQFQKFLSVFKTLSINLPLVEALLEILGSAKFMKELATKKRSMDF